ncbi:hypothetical protein CHS0354_041562, partial [Potamilus streckersoni]
MTQFNDKEESTEGVFAQFEKRAYVLNTPEENWVANILAFSAEEADKYIALKKAILCHYRLTINTYRKHSRDVTENATETHSQFHTSVRGLFETLIKMAEVERSYDGLLEVILKECVL